MKAKKMVLILLLLTLLMFLTNCGYVEFLNRSFKFPVNSSTMTKYESKDYEVLGMVKARGRSLNVLGLYVEGTEGQALLWEEAQFKYGDQVTGIKDINVLYDYKGFFPPVFSEVITTYIGVAVKEKRRK